MATAPGPSARLVRRPAPTLRFSGWSSLVTRILAVNLVALMALAFALFYIEGYRSRLLDARAQELVQQGSIISQFIGQQGLPAGRDALLRISDPRGIRLRLFDASGLQIADNWTNPAVTRFELVDPATAGFRRQSALVIDRLVDFVTGQGELPPWRPPVSDRRDAWPEAARAAATGQPATQARQTTERLVVLQAAVPIMPADQFGQHPVVVLTLNTPDVTDLVRRERSTSFLVFLAVLAVSLLLSLYLARTIVVPLRQLALAAHRVRLGRQRDVVVPRLPHRRDEIGGLARALADMTAALRERIDATESFAADVAHELKNPLASLRSAVETLGTVKDQAARAKLFALIESDVRRIDRLITDISAASRVDAELSRARLQPVDLAELVDGIAGAMTGAGPLRNACTLALELAPPGQAMVAADADRLAQVVNNLIDNAISFSPEGGVLTIIVERTGAQVDLKVLDEGPGVPAEARNAIFERFYSERPGHETYGSHSGLGLSIVRGIVEAQDGEVRVADRPDGRPGAMFVVTLPAL